MGGVGHRPTPNKLRASVTTLDIGIVGAGFAGMSAALFLARDGHRVTIYERAAVPGPVGAAIVLQPSGLSVLGELGLAQEVAADSARIDALHVVKPNGKTVIRLDYASLDARWFGLGVGRGVLFSALWRALASYPIEVETGVEVTGVTRTDRGQSIVVLGGERHAHDLIVAADGARSQVAANIPGRRVKPYPWGALFFVGPHDDVAELKQVADGARRFMGILPMGQGRASLFWSLRADRMEAWRRGFASWRDEALALGPHAAPLLETLHAPEQVVFAPYFDVRMKRWFSDGIVAIGDAAHATSPQLGQGSNLALWDAFVLAKCLREQGLTRGLPAYEAARRRHLVYYQRATRWLTPLFQSNSFVLGLVRDLTFPWVSRVGPMRRLMTASMSGVAAGFFGQRELLPCADPYAAAMGIRTSSARP